MKLFIDDLRAVPEGWQCARTFEEALTLISDQDMEAVSFDHDLGYEDGRNGLTLMNVLEELVATGVRSCPDAIYVHSANSGARRAMELAAQGIVRFR